MTLVLGALFCCAAVPATTRLAESFQNAAPARLTPLYLAATKPYSAPGPSDAGQDTAASSQVSPLPAAAPPQRRCTRQRPRDRRSAA